MTDKKTESIHAAATLHKTDKERYGKYPIAIENTGFLYGFRFEYSHDVVKQIKTLCIQDISLKYTRTSAPVSKLQSGDYIAQRLMCNKQHQPPVAIREIPLHLV